MLWARVPVSPVLRLKNSESAVALKQRLHIAPLCQRSASGHGGAACSTRLDPHLCHATLCGIGPGKMRGHNGTAA
eukprot:12927608-Prorocentrum_lima.AAC.1